jgi:hypothetical protein
VETLVPLKSEEKLKKVISAAEKWAALDKEPQATVAKAIISSRDTINIDSTIYHPGCLLSFASDSKIQAAPKSTKRKIKVSAYKPNLSLTNVLKLHYRKV